MNRPARCVALPTFCLMLVSIATAKEDHEVSLRVATAQIPVTKSISKNSVAIHRTLAVAIKEDADILLTPEGSLSGYTESYDNKCYNQIRFYDGAGKFLGFHTKTLLCGSFSDPPQGEN